MYGIVTYNGVQPVEACNSVIQRKLNNTEHLRPTLTNASKSIPDDAIDVLSLSIGLLRIRDGNIQSGAQHLGDGLPNLPNRVGFSIRDTSRRQSVMTEHNFKKQLNSAHIINTSQHHLQESHLSEQVNKDNNSWSSGVESFGRPNTKFVLMESELRTRRQAVSAYACDEGLILCHASQSRTYVITHLKSLGNQ